MNLKGELDSIGFAQLLQTLASQRATGVLTVRSDLGEKVIAIAEGEIAVLSDKLAERARIGDLLVARGLLTETQLDEALKIQRGTQQRSRLGDVLIKQGMVKPQQIVDSLRFQVEEEIYDLFTWKNASFEFDGEQSLDEAASKESTDTTLQRMLIDPQLLVAEASRRAADWELIEGRLPTPYLCFKVTPKGEELAARASSVTQHIFKLLKEGRTIETTVKRSCMGRLSVCKTIVKLLDEGWLYPYPAGELRFLAADHRGNGRFSDALYVYRRLQEAAQTEAEQTELQDLIEETIEAIRRAQAAGASVEGVETVSYREAAERFKRRQTIKRVAMLTVAGFAAIAATYWLSFSLRPPPGMHEAYQKAYQEADDARRRNQFQKAVATWQAFQIKIRDKSSPTYKLVQEQIESLQLQDSAFAEQLLERLARLEKTNLDAAKAEYSALLKDLTEKLPDSPIIPRVKTALERVAELSKQRELEKAQGERRARLADASQAVERHKYADAQKLCAQLATLLEPGSLEHDQLLGLQKDLDAVKQRAAAKVREADNELAAHHGEKAIVLFQAAGTEWPELEIAERGEHEAKRLNARLELLTQDLKAVDAVAARGLYLDALKTLQRIQREYPEFELTDTARARAEMHQAVVDRIKARAGDARERYTRGDKEQGLQLYRELMKEFSAIVEGLNLEVPLQIASTPAGATVRIDDEVVGQTPLQRFQPVAKPFTLKFELAGYEPANERRFAHLGIGDLEIHETLRRKLLENSISFKPAIYAPVRALGNMLLILHGTKLSAFDPAARQVVWSVDNLFNENASTYPNPAGGADKMVPDKSWWYPRFPLQPKGDGKFLLSLRVGKVLEIDPATQKFHELLRLPFEPIGWPHLEAVSLQGGKPLMATGCADGKIRAYDLEKPSTPMWEQPGDPSAKAGEISFATGLAPRPAGQFVFMTTRGRLGCLNIIDGRESWSVDLKAAMSPLNTLPETTRESLAALVHQDGRVTVLDLQQGARVWELAPRQPLEEAIATLVAPDSIYVATRDGVISKYSRDRNAGRPALIWKRPLDGSIEMPMFLGKNLYAVSHFGTLYAISVEDGHSYWQYPVEGAEQGRAPTSVMELNDVLYIATQDGRLIIMNAR
ncbi:MAG TPA: PQQ-binding-like beta-propeller repeat protein [Planctomycetota bacterium]|jgi:hypothetical protein